MCDVPVGVRDFKEIRDRGLYFADKSPIIDRVLGRLREAQLIARPGGFGRSVNLKHD